MTRNAAVEMEQRQESERQQGWQALVDACVDHYDRMEVNEKEILPWFIYNARNQGVCVSFLTG